MTNETEFKTERISLRVSVRVKRVLQQAAAAQNKTLSGFILDAAIKEATEILAAQPMIILDPQQWNAFQEALDAPPQLRPRLEALLREPSVWE